MAVPQAPVFAETIQYEEFSVTPKAQKTTNYYVALDSGYLNVRKSPSLTATIVGRAQNGATLKVVRFVKNKQWAEILHNGKLYYVSAQFLKKKGSSQSTSGFPAKYVVNNISLPLNVRSKPNTSSKIVATLKPGKTVTALGMVNSQWMAIKYKKKTRYVFAQYLHRK